MAFVAISSSDIATDKIMKKELYNREKASIIKDNVVY